MELRKWWSAQPEGEFLGQLQSITLIVVYIITSYVCDYSCILYIIGCTGNCMHGTIFHGQCFVKIHGYIFSDFIPPKYKPLAALVWTGFS